MHCCSTTPFLLAGTGYYLTYQKADAISVKRFGLSLKVTIEVVEIEVTISAQRLDVSVDVSPLSVIIEP